MSIIGIKKEFVDEETDVPTCFHVVSSATIDYDGEYQTAQISSYFKQATFEKGGRPVGTFHVTLTGRPTRNDNISDWVLQAVVADVQGKVDAFGQPLEANRFTGGELVQSK